MRRSTPVVLSLLFLAILLTIGSSHSTASGPGAADPMPSAFSVSSGPGSRAKEGAPVEISQTAWQQIQSLIQEKAARSPVQQKIDSQLLYAIKLNRREPIASSVQTLTVEVGADDAGLVTVDITALVDKQLLGDLDQMGVKVVSAFPRYHTLRAVASLKQLETIAALPQVGFVAPKQEAMFSQSPVRPGEVDPGISAYGKRAERIQSRLRPVRRPATWVR